MIYDWRYAISDIRRYNRSKITYRISELAYQKAKNSWLFRKPVLDLVVIKKGIELKDDIRLEISDLYPEKVNDIYIFKIYCFSKSERRMTSKTNVCI